LGEVSVRAGHIAPQDQEAALVWLGIKDRERRRQVRRATITSYIALAISGIPLSSRSSLNPDDTYRQEAHRFASRPSASTRQPPRQRPEPLAEPCLKFPISRIGG
jgi:hypothetical protein